MMRIRIINTDRNIYLGTDPEGNRVTGRAGKEFNVPSQLDKRYADQLIKAGIAMHVEEKPVPEKKETATVQAKETATKGAETKPKRTRKTTKK